MALHAGKLGPSGYQVEKELKMAAVKNPKKWALLLSLTVLITTFKQHLEILYEW